MNEIEVLKSEVMTIPQLAREVAAKITDNEGYSAGGQFLLEIKRRRKQVDAACDPTIDATNKAHKEAVAQKKMFEAPLAQAESIIKPALAAYDTAQENIRRDEERRLQELARKQEEDRRLAEAVELEQQGDKKAADAVMAEPVYIPPVVIAKTVPTVAGVSYRDVWKYRIVNVDALPRAYLMPDETKIGAYARAMKGAGLIPGVEIYSEKTVAGRG
jgi:hypothetical protein